MLPARTNSSKVHRAWKDNDPIVHGVENVATVKLVKKPPFNSYATEFEVVLTKSPSVSHWFKGNAI